MNHGTRNGRALRLDYGLDKVRTLTLALAWTADGLGLATGMESVASLNGFHLNLPRARPQRRPRTGS